MKDRIVRELVDWLLILGVIVTCALLFAALYWGGL